ncbi:lincosamide and streptogramin A transport system ATP-binding/permease protein [Eubacterium aggregans]|uniref:Lincosamide and streptogramin A transport system ATP-binding/permease protein n=3 Tax=Eubacterium aggregans TaxID=81409 RepID=A0A1H4DXY9_9FIRM|nr:ABC-F type ribosomal protection protein [Eubacterium aggregans]SEA77349.1 lincosamide and streptogramin A transport system ATP-binding/permease protein [Eubacterium aggregans]
MSQIAISKLGFTYEGSHEIIFDKVDLVLDTRWKLGLIGRNGRGKTTLLKLLCGEFPYTGSITATVDFDYFPYPVADPGKPTREVVAGIAPEAMDWEVERELSLLEVDEAVLERPYHLLSGGESTKVLLAALFLKAHRFLLIDEPTNHLDEGGRAAVSRYLKGKRGFIVVSHDRHFLDGCTDHILAINRRGITLQKGNYTCWREEKERQDRSEEHQNANLKKEIKRLKAAARQRENWSDQVEKTKKGTRVAGLRPDRGHIGAVSAKMMKRAKAIDSRRQDAVAEKSALLQNIENLGELKLTPLPYCKNNMVTVEGFTIDYGEGALFAPLSFTLSRGDRIALRGCNGSGKSSLLKCICGGPVPHAGECLVGSGLGISRVCQDAREVVGNLKDYAESYGIEESRFKAILRKMGFEREHFDGVLEAMSPGQKKKVMLARSLCESAHLYLWDEPLNDMDVQSREQVEALLLQSQGTILFVEHDQAFCEAVATREIVLRKPH